MSGRIMIIDAVATNRIVLKVKLMTAQYRTTTCASLAEARESIRAERPDLVLIELAQSAKDALAFCRTLRQTPETATTPVIGMTGPLSPVDRLAAFEAGLDDLLVKPMSDNLLLARIRSLLRAADVTAELRLREGTSRALGFAEPDVPFSGPGQVALIAEYGSASLSLARQLSKNLGQEVTLIEADSAFSKGLNATSPDLFIIDGRGTAPGRDEGRLFRLVADLRSRSETRLASQLVIVPDNAAEFGAMALDLGTNDAAPESTAAGELALRVRALLRRKQEQDRLRAALRTGVEAALTDPLTGLFNRRYAMPHLAAMAEQSAVSGREFAVLAIDVDHFKQINDRYGHAVGDRVLTALAGRLRDCVRPVDLVARIGGEEFLIVLPDTSRAIAEATAQRLRRDVEKSPLVENEVSGPIHVTLSIGVAFGSQSQTAEDCDRLLERADSALYAAKATGRNRVEISRERAA